MMKMSPSIHRSVALLLLVLVATGAYAAFERVWLQQYRYYSDQLSELQDRLWRYQRLLGARDQLADTLAVVRQDSSADAYYLDQTAPPLAATELQQRVSRAVQASGGSLSSSQILPAGNEQGFTRVAIRVQLTGDVNTLQQTLYALESAQPMLFVDNVQVRSRTIRQRVRATRGPDGRPLPASERYRTEVQLIAQFDVAGYMRKG
jgi:general secretion pathway protein M